MSTLWDGDTIERGGRTFRVNIEQDERSDAPWDLADGHGPVRRSQHRHAEGSSDKRPSERPMNQPGHNEYQFYYDWQAAVKLARKDGWNTAPYDAPNRIQRAVQADFDFLRGWVNNDWSYVGVIVTDITEDEGAPTDYGNALWGIESCAGEYLLEVAHELADDAIRSRGIDYRFADAMACGV